jgi:hypothetical protein
MGKTHHRNDRWKKDQRDQNFRNSKKFKDFQKNKLKPSLPLTVDSEPKDVNELDIDIDDNI